LIGIEGTAGEAEVIALTLEALDAAGLARHRIGLGDGALYRSLLRSLEVPPERHGEVLARLSTRDLVGLELVVDRLGLARDARELLERANGPLVGDALHAVSALHAELTERGVADRVILDLGLLRMLGYYTGAIYEVYDPAVGFTLGGGGRYDDLIGRFGAPRPACGVALDVQRVHLAQAAEEGLR
jgi:ATP phosphoribosyltransferase regulatory subunit